jgi:hypothetical protein
MLRHGGNVEHAISGLLAAYEAGAVNRRQFIGALALLGSAGTALPAAQLSAGALDHLSCRRATSADQQGSIATCSVSRRRKV